MTGEKVSHITSEEESVKINSDYEFWLAENNFRVECTMKEKNHYHDSLETKNKNCSTHLLITAPTHFLDGVREEIENKYKVTYAYGASYSQLEEKFQKLMLG